MCWLDFADINGINSASNRVLNVKNKGITNTFFITQGNAALRPYTNTRTVNGNNVLDFDGTHKMQFISNDPVDAPFTIFVVSGFDSSTAQMELIARHTGTISGEFSLRKEASGTTFNTFAFVNDGTSSQTNVSGNLNSNIHCVYYADGSRISYSINNNFFSTGSVKSGYSNSCTTPLYLGSGLDGFIGEIIIFNKILNLSEITQINQYLSRKWGIGLVA